MKKKIWVSLGDPLSINVELLVQSQTDLEPLKKHLVLVGSRTLVRRELSFLGEPQMLDSYEWIDLDPELGSFTQKEALELSAKERGVIACSALKVVGTKLKTEGGDSLSLAINKHACAEAGFPYPGQTEFFESVAGQRAIMLLAGPLLKVGLVTNHLGLKEVPGQLNQELIIAKIGLLEKTLKKVYHPSKRLRLAICGLNPHTGESGRMGMEELLCIGPAIKKASELFDSELVGPLPADTVFFRAFEGEFDAVLAMYHDQGLGPLKTVHFYEAVNISGGLPFLRVSPDHGPAVEIYRKSQARADSLRRCLELFKHQSSR